MDYFLIILILYLNAMLYGICLVCIVLNYFSINFFTLLVLLMSQIEMLNHLLYLKPFNCMQIKLLVLTIFLKNKTTLLIS